MDQKDFVLFHSEYLNSYIKQADVKAAAISTINGLIIGFLTDYLYNNDYVHIKWLLLTSLLLLIISIIFSALVFYPRTKAKNSKGIIFWENVRMYSLNSYRSKVLNCNYKDLVGEVVEQNYYLALTATKKYKVLRRSFLFATISYVTIIFWFIVNL